MSELGENSRAPSVFVLLHCTSHSATRAAPSRAQIVKVGLPAVQPTWGGKLPTGSQSCFWGNGGWSRPYGNRTCWPAGAGGPAELAGPCFAAASPPTPLRRRAWTRCRARRATPWAACRWAAASPRPDRPGQEERSRRKRRGPREPCRAHARGGRGRARSPAAALLGPAPERHFRPAGAEAEARRWSRASAWRAVIAELAAGGRGPGGGGRVWGRAPSRLAWGLGAAAALAWAAPGLEVGPPAALFCFPGLAHLCTRCAGRGISPEAPVRAVGPSFCGVVCLSLVVSLRSAHGTVSASGVCSKYRRPWCL